MTAIDEAFQALPLERLADAALSRARALGAAYACVRVHQTQTARLELGNGAVRGNEDTTSTGLGVRMARGGWGFAAGSRLTPRAAESAAERAAALASATDCGPGAAEPAPGPEPGGPAAPWVSTYRIDPFSVPAAERAAVLAAWSVQLLRAPHVRMVQAHLTAVRDITYYADLAGTTALQQRVRIHPLLFVFGEDPRTGATAVLRTLGPPTARGWEYLDGDGWDWAAELAALPGALADKLAARPVEPGSYDIVMDPSHLWLTIHETVGHATEADRAVGHEMSYAGGTFVRADGVGSQRYGSALMHIVADRTQEHGLATVGYDDEGVAAQRWDLVRGGVLAGLQHDRRTAALTGAGLSTGCAAAATGLDVPLARMPNVSLRPDPDGPDTAGLISAVRDGLYLVGSDSFSIDDRRRAFQFSAQRCYRIRDGRLGPQVAGAAYQGETVGFWSALQGVGGPGTYGVFGADMCGKGQPVQLGASSHGAPATLFGGVQVINTLGAS
jgi:TldD protein